jgi:hypothetical protein
VRERGKERKKERERERERVREREREKNMENLPIESSSSIINEISVLSSDKLSFLCTRNSSNLQIKCFHHNDDNDNNNRNDNKKNENKNKNNDKNNNNNDNNNNNNSITISSLRLKLPKETSNRVINTNLSSISPLLLNILTLTGTLIILDLSSFLVDNRLPELLSFTDGPSNQSFKTSIPNTITNTIPNLNASFPTNTTLKKDNDNDDSDNNSDSNSREKEKERERENSSSQSKPISLFELSNSPKKVIQKNKITDSKSRQRLPYCLTLEQTLGLAISIKELGFQGESG